MFGGIQTFLMSVYKNIDRERLQFDFLLTGTTECVFSDEIRKMGGRIYAVPSRREGVIKNKKALDIFFKNHREYTIVHAHFGNLSYVDPLKYARKNGVPVRIVHSRNNKTIRVYT